MYAPPSEKLSVSFAGAAALWTGSLFLAVRLAASPDHGPIGYLFSAGVYYAGSLVCHQRPERSFHFWGAQLPVCARCAGIYMGALVAALSGVVLPSRRRALPSTVFLWAALAVNALTLVYEWSTGAAPPNGTRAVAGAALGAAVGWLVVRRARAANVR